MGVSGGIIIAPLNEINTENAQILSKEYEGSEYVIFGVPYSLVENIVNIENNKIVISPKNYGESRINITDSSKVSLSSENQARATKEALLINLSSMSQPSTLHTYPTKLHDLCNADNAVISSISTSKGMIAIASSISFHWSSTA